MNTPIAHLQQSTDVDSQHKRNNNSSLTNAQEVAALQLFLKGKKKQNGSDDVSTKTIVTKSKMVMVDAIRNQKETQRVEKSNSAMRLEKKIANKVPVAKNVTVMEEEGEDEGEEHDDNEEGEPGGHSIESFEVEQADDPAPYELNAEKEEYEEAVEEERTDFEAESIEEISEEHEDDTVEIPQVEELEEVSESTEEMEPEGIEEIEAEEVLDGTSEELYEYTDDEGNVQTGIKIVPTYALAYKHVLRK